MNQTKFLLIFLCWISFSTIIRCQEDSIVGLIWVEEMPEFRGSKNLDDFTKFVIKNIDYSNIDEK